MCEASYSSDCPIPPPIRTSDRGGGQGPVERCRENSKPGESVFSVHATNTSPTITSWPPDFVAEAQFFGLQCFGHAVRSPIRFLEAPSALGIVTDKPK